MFDNLSERLGGILDRLTGRGALTEKDVDAAMREVRRALLEADVALEVVRSFTERVREQAIGATVVKSVTPGQMVVKIVHDELINTLGAEGQTIDINSVPPVPIMMVGLQGSGKTTTTAKLARRMVQRDKRKVLMASLDVYRPAAMEQLAVLGRDLDIPTLPIVAGQQPAQIAKRALEAGKLGGYDVVLLDTAGRTTLDEDMMAEAAAIKAAANPHEVLLVADSLTGQDAVNLARAFDERVGLTGIVLTRVDGDGRGGAALSMRAVTGKPIKLIGTGEKTDALEDFHPDRIAGRILGMGDVVSLVERAAANIDAEKAARTAERMRKGQFDLNDMREQLSQMANMGGISGLMGMMPGISKMKNQIAAAGIDDKILKRQVAIIDSMTRDERRHPDLLKASRKKRIAAGSGQSVEHVNKLLKMHRNMADVMKAMGSGKRGPLAGIAQAMGFGGGMKMPSPEEMKAMQEKMQSGGGQGLPNLPKDLPPGLRTGLPNLPGLTGLSGKPTLPGLGGFTGKKK
ncbi:signal recognition particle subunit SRP54 [Bradyrhizobium diazoefficiens]|uniref:Signal recognition particle protein n=1 Tax=Bradyrhizobium diazoefficiens TaxID=1355477 RepID=A0A0E4BPV5_9BRAD|nr:signal recognition particle protein [Bradyrhizobium diazoefficiens]MBR0864068.1 signal recognition particle protein [Bradyrhizobium diazoefficiens]MBR0888702.1 signal recognition particle protein [Bradyrhizobium diazoefficiens]MBR0920463.1 signal recognition particle protein [Bradyrhizobium diazoefficiens]WLA65753.1 signal recognition particle protein [Bradyrhizobium diazoefficiens]BAR57192.1 signal recognition particle protein [Bradyrhizobium diazoefficiens]